MLIPSLPRCLTRIALRLIPFCAHPGQLQSPHRHWHATAGTAGGEDGHSRVAGFLELPVCAETPLSAVHRGLRYEMQAMDVLGSHGFDLSHTGQVGDGGVDMRGAWVLPDGTRVKATVQCKNSTKRIGPKYIRELEGTLVREKADSLGLLVSPVGFTPQAVVHFNTTVYPLVLVVVCGLRRGCM